tara:strand:- start:555 stop:746 length:192 start_codon:yes stop_codon:yes gene_type:complete
MEETDFKMLTADQVRSKLQDRRLAIVAEKCGLTFMSLSRIRKNDGNPSSTTLEKLSKYFNDYP